MHIRELFDRPVDRPINGVIKADQDDAASVWQELDEYVVTKELDTHFRRFFAAFLEGIDNVGDLSVIGKAGVWISGFFGSGKSHFLKILSYLLANNVVAWNGQSRRAIDFFDGKLQDAMLAADMKRAVAADTDVILFNIDSKADSVGGRDAILRVFLKVFNEMRGYSGDHPHVADMERRLDELGKLAAFKDAFRAHAGADWAEERDAYSFYADEMVKALTDVLSKSADGARAWLTKSEQDFDSLLTVEHFAGWVREYLDSRGPAHRIVFLVDEVGQFIGQDTHLMLSLQTIVENLGTACGGRAWVVVTSQEDIDAVVGELRANRANDFSKIQGRFRTRLSLSSGNVDEVIEKRLLAKTDAARTALEQLYLDNADILRNQLSFSNVGMTFKPYADAAGFAAVYPFAPYQFQLVQKVFEAIRRHGVTGLHLARGERSMLDAFQSAAVQLGGEPVGILVPLYRFYPAIESFLESIVKSTIDSAAANAKLEPFDVLVLKTLFLIRYVEEIRGNLDNLVTLFVDRIDADRLALRRDIEASLQRLERETLVSRNGEDFFFLTNEERDISREIKGVELNGNEEAKLLAELIFEDVLKGQRKHRFPDNGKDFGLTRLCDLHPHGQRGDGDLIISVVTPLADDYAQYDEAKCVLGSAADGGSLIVRLGDDPTLARELRTYIQTDKYFNRKFDSTASHSTQRILRERKEENLERRQRLVLLLQQRCAEAALYAAGQPVATRATAAAAVIADGLNYLVRNSFTKLGYLEHLSANPQAEIKAVLSATDVDDLGFSLDAGQGNLQAINEVAQTVALMAAQNRPMTVDDLVQARFGRLPYGWPEWEVVLLLARLARRGDISLTLDGDVLPAAKAFEALTAPSRWRHIGVIKRKSVDSAALASARQLAKDVFGNIAPDGEDALDAHLRTQLGNWQRDLGQYRTLADTGSYPGRDVIADGQGVTKKLLAEADSVSLIGKLLDLKADLLDLADDVHELRNFYDNQRPAWDRLRQAEQRFAPNRDWLEQDTAAARALTRIREILAAPAPYAMVHEADGLIAGVAAANDALVAAQRDQALPALDAQLAKVQAELDAARADAGLRNQCLYPLQQLKEQVKAQTSIAHIQQASSRALELADAAFARIEAALRPKPQPKPKPGPDPEPVAPGIKDDPAEPALKPRRAVMAAALTPKPLLESKEDVDAYLDKLRSALEKALADGYRIEIR
jgi:hypothetical protein